MISSKRIFFFYRSGIDQNGRTILFFVACHLPTTATDLERVLRYCVNLMDSIHSEYFLVYFHSNMQKEQQPEYGWLKRLHEIFDTKYGGKLKGFYVVHPTFWLKLLFSFLNPFLSGNVYNNLKYIDKLSELYQLLDRKQLNIPEKVLDYEKAVFPNDKPNEDKDL